MSYLQRLRERPTFVIWIAIPCLLAGAPVLIFGVVGMTLTLRRGDAPGAMAFMATLVPTGALLVATGYGLLTRQRWSRISALIVCAGAAIMFGGGVINALIKDRDFFNTGLNMFLLIADLRIGYYLLLPSTKLYFLEDHREDERILKI